MSVELERRVDCMLSLQLNTAIGTTPEIPFEAFSGGQIHIPTGSSITTLTWWTAPFQTGRPSSDPNLNAANKQTQTFQPAQDATGAAVTQTVAAAKSYPIPTALFGAGSLKCVVNSAGPVDISLKT